MLIAKLLNTCSEWGIETSFERMVWSWSTAAVYLLAGQVLWSPALKNKLENLRRKPTTLSQCQQWAQCFLSAFLPGVPLASECPSSLVQLLLRRPWCCRTVRVFEGKWDGQFISFSSIVHSTRWPWGSGSPPRWLFAVHICKTKNLTSSGGSCEQSCEIQNRHFVWRRQELHLEHLSLQHSYYNCWL